MDKRTQWRSFFTGLLILLGIGFLFVTQSHIGGMFVAREDHPMHYVNQFEAAGFMVTLVVLALYLMRRIFFSKSCQLFLTIAVGNLVLSLLDYISSYTISYPSDYPVWLNYLASFGFFLLYNGLALVLVLYADSLAKIPRLERVVRYGVLTTAVVEGILLATSPFTHLIIYFDAAMQYRHGPIFPLFYASSLICMLLSIAILANGRVRYCSYQNTSFVLFLFSMVCCICIQIVRPDLLLSGFGVSLILIFLYVTFENPAYYNYRDSQCFNRDAFIKAVRVCIKRQEPISVIALGLNDYTDFEKTHGRTRMVNLSRWLADQIGDFFGENGYMLADDRAAVILTGDQLGQEETIRERLSALFEGPVNLREGSIQPRVTCVVLPSEYSFPSTDELMYALDMLLENHENVSAEDALAQVEEVVWKKQCYDGLIHAIEKAVDNESFQVYYQPIYNVKTGKFSSAEALVRLFDDELGAVSPEEFVPIAERSGHIRAMGEIVFRKVCEFMRDHDYKSLGVGYIEINLSPVQCLQDGLADEMFDIMLEAGIEPGAVNFEITETSEIAITAPLMKNVLDMNGRGITFSMDDFGSGFAAMDCLFKLPVDLVKVDKSILWQAMEDEKAMTVLISTIHMVHELDKKILVEGVETQEMVDVLLENGCDYMQGYFYSRPIPPEEFIAFLKEHN